MPSLIVQVTPAALIYDKKLLRATLRVAGAEIAGTARRLMRASPPVGALYRGANAGKRASAPGAAPRPLSGLLARSVRVRAIMGGDGVAVRDTAWYALALEAGARARGGARVHRARGPAPVGGLRMQPRPYLSVALAQRAPSLLPRIAAAMQSGIKLVQVKA